MSTNTAALDADELMQLALRATDRDETEQAIGYLKQVLALDSDHPDAMYLLGALHAELGLFARAIEEITRAVELKPDLPTAHFQLGLLHLGRGDVEAAERAWRSLDSLGEGDCLYLFKRGMLHLADDRFSECLQDLDRGMAINTVNESLNSDMRNVRREAEKMLGSRDPTGKGIPAKPEPRGAGRHLLLSKYQVEPDED